MDTWLLCKQVDGDVCVSVHLAGSNAFPGELTDPLKAGGQAATPVSQTGRQITLSQGRQERCIL